MFLFFVEGGGGGGWGFKGLGLTPKVSGGCGFRDLGLRGLGLLGSWA